MALRYCLLALLLSCVQAIAEEQQPITGQPVPVIIKTDMGDIAVELYPAKAPQTVANFLAYVRRYYYDGLIFHRVVRNYIIQSGGYTFDLFAKTPGEPIPNESANGLKNTRGAIAMARLDDPDSARAQFFFNLQNNGNLDSSGDKPGYTVFGKVTSGMDVVDAIGNLEVQKSEKFGHLPVQAVRILSIREVQSP